MRIARAVAASGLPLLLVLSLTGCSSDSDQPAAAAPTPTAATSGFTLATPQDDPTPGAASGQASAPSSAGASAAPAPSTQAPGAQKYPPIAEPFSAPDDCDENGTTAQLANCVLQQVVDVDSTVNSLQQSMFERTSKSRRAGVLAEFSRWLAGRTTTCRAQAKSGGSIDQVKAAQCLLLSSQDRVETLNDVLSSY
jgi:uncharacterized protein YecT (DUF1311 family)